MPASSLILRDGFLTPILEASENSAKQILNDNENFAQS